MTGRVAAVFPFNIIRMLPSADTIKVERMIAARLVPDEHHRERKREGRGGRGAGHRLTGQRMKSSAVRPRPTPSSWISKLDPGSASVLAWRIVRPAVSKKPSSPVPRVPISASLTKLKAWLSSTVRSASINWTSIWSPSARLKSTDAVAVAFADAGSGLGGVGYGPELEHIGARTAGQLVDVQTADEDIVAVVTEDTVATAAARDPVVAGAAEETVVAIKA